MDTLKQAKQLADDILDMTRRVVISGESEKSEVDAEAYSALLDDREPLIFELTDLRLQISDEEVATEQFVAICNTLSQVAEIEKNHIAVIERLRGNAQSSYKGVKQGQRIAAGYNHMPQDEASSKINITH